MKIYTFFIHTWFMDLLLSLNFVGWIVLFCYETQLITIAILQIWTFARKSIGVKSTVHCICLLRSRKSISSKFHENTFPKVRNSGYFKLDSKNYKAKHLIWRQVWIFGDHFFFFLYPATASHLPSLAVEAATPLALKQSRLRYKETCSVSGSQKWHWIAMFLSFCSALPS